VNARNALLSLSVVLATSLTSCGTLNRAAKDLTVGALTIVPVIPIYGGATDGATSAQNWREGMGSGAAVEVLAFPFTFLYHGIEHFCYGLIHILDLPLCLFYGAAELHPSGPEIKPLDTYRGTWFDTWAGTDEKKSGTDAESGETK
jgi:hypothetical protein